MNWDRVRVLVTGAGGFIGSHLTERLVSEKAEVRALVHYNSRNSWGWLDDSEQLGGIEVYSGDIRDLHTVRAAAEGVEVIFHLAALIGIPYSYVAPISYLRTNVEGTMNVLQVAREMGSLRVIHTSTSEVYGTARSVPIDEKHELQGQSPYSASKIAADKFVEAYHRSFDVPVVTVRPFNTFGPRQSARAVIPTIITQAITQSTVRLGNLNALRDFTYVSDTVEGFLKSAQTDKAIGHVLNLGTGQSVMIGEVANRVLEMTDSRARVVQETERVRPPSSEVDQLCADATRAKEVLEWKPEVGFDEGLGKTVDWIRDHLDRYRPHIYSV